MSKLPSISAKDLITILEKYGYEIVRQKGSHIRMKNYKKGCKPITIPNHKEIGIGLIRKIIRNTNLSLEEFKNML
jgi:predicted RNA binding protein YcfA (HicA-like mRNA interferase family)